MPTSFLPFAIAIVVAISATLPLKADETGLAAMHAWRPESGKICMVDHYHSGSGTGPSKAAARKAAITSWQEFTAFEYGLDWAYFSRAASRGIAYSRTSTGWLADVEARPCKRR